MTSLMIVHIIQEKNYTLNHLIERIKIYNEEKFNYDIITINLKIMEDDFYATIKFKSGEEVLLKYVLRRR